jgi:hypothetical protein
MRRIRSGLALVAIVGVVACNHAAPAIPALSRDNVESVKATFNAGASGPRMVVFFSSGCAACDTGSAALQNMLRTLDSPVTVLAVWEPIVESDPSPTRKLLGNFTDVRVHQLWDPDHLMSDAMRASELAHPGSPAQARTRTNSAADGVMYDTVAIFAPGTRWEMTLPAPDYLDVGLEAILPEVHARLATIVAPDPSK